MYGLCTICLLGNTQTYRFLLDVGMALPVHGGHLKDRNIIISLYIVGTDCL
jgi:hypothetical protein